MAGEIDQTLVATDTPAIDEGRNDSRVESDALVTSSSSSSSTHAVIKMVDNRVSEMSDY
jgi:hypothetical protein